MQALSIIKDEHRNLWRIAITVEQVIAEMERDHKVEAAFLGSVLDYFEHFMDGCHHRKEDEHLFPVLRQRAPSAAALLDRLQAEHRNAPHNLAALRGQLANTVAGHGRIDSLAEAFRRYLNDQKAHIKHEERDIYGLASDVLTPADWAGQGMAAGTPFSLAHSVGQTGPFRPPNLERRRPGVFLAGTGTTPGVGIPMVLISGELAARRVRDYLGAPR